jgi:hypothetical protein
VEYGENTNFILLLLRECRKPKTFSAFGRIQGNFEISSAVDRLQKENPY